MTKNHIEEAISDSVSGSASTERALDLALEAAYLAGFNASGEGYNGEYGIDCPEENAIWKKDRDNALTAIRARGTHD